MTANRNSLTTLATFTSEMEGQMVVNLLREQGIAATAFASHFLPGALESVRVVVDQESLSTARSMLAEHEFRQLDESLDSEEESFRERSLKNGAESPVFQPWLTRFGITTLLIGSLFAMSGIFIYWCMGGHNVVSVASLVVPALFIAAILAGRKYFSN